MICCMDPVSSVIKDLHSPAPRRETHHHGVDGDLDLEKMQIVILFFPLGGDLGKGVVFLARGMLEGKEGSDIPEEHQLGS